MSTSTDEEGHRYFICPRCGAKSYHPEDILEGYCGRCHDYTGGKER